MKLAQASAYFCHTPVDLWDGQAWFQQVTKATLQVAPRTASTRSLHQRPRLLKLPQALDSKWQCARLPNGEVYVLASYNADMRGTDAYTHLYQMVEAPYPVDIARFQTTKLASGAPGAKTRTVVAQTYGGYYPGGSTASSEFDTVSYGQFTVYLPGAMGQVLSEDCELDLDGATFTIEQYGPQGISLLVTARRRQG